MPSASIPGHERRRGVNPELRMMPLHRVIILFATLFLASCIYRDDAPAPVYERGASSTGVAAVSVPQPMVSHPDRISVEKGETLYAVSRRYRVPVRTIIETNHLAPPYQLSAGMVLRLPQVRQHVVQPGDTLTSISTAYGVDASSLARGNQLEPPYPIKVGQALLLPAPAERVPPPSRSSVAASTLPPPPPRVQVQNQPQNRPSTNPSLPPSKPAYAPPVPARTATLLTHPSPNSAASNPPAPPAPAPYQPPQQASARGFIWPVQGRIISGYGTSENGTHNDGVNIAAPSDTRVLAAAPGVVAYAGNELRGYGNLVLIKHEGGYLTAYAHNASLLVKRGDRVARGQMIARVGATGAVAEPQLHFEIRAGSRAVDPTSFLPAITASAGG